jgi:hypothetical protein
MIYLPPPALAGGELNDPLTFDSQLVSVLLPDGSTPESQGYTLTFGSGMASPNLAPAAAVPAPPSWLLLAIGGGTLFGRRCLGLLSEPTAGASVLPGGRALDGHA